MATTYSATDVSFIISHKLLGKKQTAGEGWGSISVAMDDDHTNIAVGADGASMISKINSNKGTITLEVQQTSPLNNWLVNAYNKLNKAATNRWAEIEIDIKELFDNGIKITATKGAFKKLADHKNGTNGDSKTWTFVFATITEGAA